MKNNVYRRAFLPVRIVFILLTVLSFLSLSVLQRWNTDVIVLASGNAILYAVTVISYWLHVKSLRSPNPHVFVRMVYSSLLVKMLVCLVAVLLYAKLTTVVNRNAIIGCFILYIIYTFLEVRILTQLTKKLPKNA
jgi:hypothetical protein